MSQTNDDFDVENLKEKQKKRERTTHSWHEGFDCDFDKSAEAILCLNEGNTEKYYLF